MARVARLDLPGEIRRHVDGGRTAGHGNAATQAGQPFVVAQYLPYATLGAKARAGVLDFGKHAVEGVGIDTRVLAQCAKRAAVTFKILQTSATEVCSNEAIEDIEQRGDGMLKKAPAL